MEIFLTEYITSFWGFMVNLSIVVVFSVAAYNVYAKRWSAKSGQHKTTGYITWSSLMPGTKPPVLVSAHPETGNTLKIL